MATNTTETVRQLQRTLYSKAKQVKEAQFYSLYDKVWRADVLWEAWQQVKANKGAPGVDGQAIEAIVAGGQDRVVQTAMKLVLEPIFEADFHPCSYGYRPKRDAKMASQAIKENLYDHAW